MGIIEVRDLSYTYPNAKAPALCDISLEIEEGEFILLTGPSGCGKTTFCRALNGLIPHFYKGQLEGRVSVAGLDTQEHPTLKLAQSVGLIFQNPDNQIFALTVEKDIAFGLENLGVPKERMKEEVAWASENTGISHLMDRATHELSGGQKQRLTIASILAMHPRIIVMDEPTSFLDPLGAERIFGVLSKLNQEYGMTIILIEHRMDLAVKHAERIIVFNEGRVINDGPPDLIFTDPETKLIGVGIPRIVELAQRFRDRGLSFERLPLTADDFFSDIHGYLPPASQVPEPSIDLSELDDLTGEYVHKPIIEVKDVSFDYPGDVHALRDVSLTIHQGDFVAIMGENGAGKTTLVKHFNGLLTPKEGQVFVGGVDVSSTTVASLSRSVGLVFQSPDDQLFEENVEREISFALRNFGFQEEVIKQRVDWALNLLEIERYRKSSPFILSGGERKRVALASVLAWDPEILVLDEPTIGQDYGQKERLRHFLKHLRTQGKTIVIVTHDVEFVAEIQPRIVLMAQGKVVAEGTAKKIMTDFEVLQRCSVAPPEITRLFSRLKAHGLPGDVLDVNEGYDILRRSIRGVEV